MDGLKDINDSFGHVGGDKVINGTKRIFSGLMNESEVPIEAGRIGGDEFAALVMGGGEEVAKAIEDLEKRFNDYADQPENQSFKEKGLGLSVGSATLSKDMINSSDLLRKADEAMYQHKTEKLDKLTRQQEMALIAARKMLEHQGVRLRDVPKHWRSIDGFK